MTEIEFKFLVEHLSENGWLKSRFTNEKHAIHFVKKMKKDGIQVKLFEIEKDGTLKPRLKKNT